MKVLAGWLLIAFCVWGAPSWADVFPTSPSELDAADRVQLTWGVKIPMRDGVRLDATVYNPRDQKAPTPCIFTLTPYIAQSYHARGIYFASHGLSFLTVDVRGRGNSQGEFRPFLQEAHDGYDVVEWLAKQPYCNGKVSMWGGSYAGYDQWVTAKEFPPHLATIIPAASPYAGVDFPMSGGVFSPYDMQWLTFTGGRASQQMVFADSTYWAANYRRWFKSGKPFASLDTLLGSPSPIFQDWVSHPHPDAYWDTYNPTAEQYGKLAIPILTITGSHDDDQPGALTHYREYMKQASPAGRARHYLIIGPWDHAGTRTPSTQFGGLTFGPATLLDLQKLHLEWYAWTMQDGPKPAFLRKPVAYYVMYADKWRYADTLEAVTGSTRALHLDSAANANDVLSSGTLTVESARGPADHYLYDPRDVSTADLEATVDPESLVDQRMTYALRGKQLVYHTAPFDKDTEISGVFRLSAWMAIDQPDTDFGVIITEIREDGTSIELTSENLRARYRESAREPKLISTRGPLRYDFDHFTFVSQEVKKGSRLRLIIGPINSIYREKNYNSGGAVQSESMADARPVTVTLYHDQEHPSTLYVPLGAAPAADEPTAPSSAFSAP
jgi:putative CocE/NonD family hydrolase